MGALSFMLLIGMVAVIRPAKAQFIISVASDPDEHGQGMNEFAIFENSTGSWEWIDAPFHIWYSAPHEFEWNASVFMKIRCENYLNATVTGAVDLADGKNYQRNNVSVESIDGIVFSQQNFTYLSSAEVGGLYYYTYEVVLNFLPIQSTIYTVTINYEVFY